MKKEIDVEELRKAYEEFLKSASDRMVCELVFSEFGKIMYNITMSKIGKRPNDYTNNLYNSGLRR